MVLAAMVLAILALQAPLPVFGKAGEGDSCGGLGASCNNDKDCCSGYTCIGSGWNKVCFLPPTPAPVTPSPTEAPVTSAPSTSPVSPAPTDAPSKSPVTPSPTDAPISPAPTDAPITPSPTEAPVSPAPTDAPSKSPVTPSPTDAPISPAPTDAPITLAPTEAPVSPAPMDSPSKSPVTPSPTEAPVTPSPTEAPVTPAPTKAPVSPAPTDAPSKSPVTPSPTDAPVTSSPTKAPTAPPPAPLPTFDLITPQTGGYYNNIPGYFFDLRASGESGVSIKQLAVRTVNAGTLRIFTRDPTPSVSAGHTASDGGWQFLGSASVPQSSEVVFVLPEELIIPQGETRAFHVFSDGYLQGNTDPASAYDDYHSDNLLTMTHNWAVPYLWSSSYFGSYNLNRAVVQYSQFQPPPTVSPAPTPAPTPSPPLCPADDPSKYNMCIGEAMNGSYSQDWAGAVGHAREKWESIITDDLPSMTLDPNDARLQPCAADMPTTADDLYICMKDPYIDGPSGILGSAGPTSVSSPLFLPYAGHIEFDSADIESMLLQGTWKDVIMHEMGHILGIGSIWDHPSHPNPTVNGFTYTGTNGCREWQTITGCAGCPPIETEGGSGTAGGHWNEEGTDGMALDHELMTGYVESAGTYMPISKITVGALDDLGYQVDYAAADEYTDAPQCSRRSLRAKAAGVRYLANGGDGIPAQVHDADGSRGRPRLSNQGKARAVQYGRKKLNRANANRPPQQPGSVYVGGEYIDVMYQENGTVFFVGVRPCKRTNAHCTSSDQCCSGVCDGDQKCE